MRGVLICVHTCILMDSFITLKRPSTHLRIPRRKLSFRIRLPQVYTLSCKSWPHKIQPVSINLLFSRVLLFTFFFLCFWRQYKPDLKRHIYSTRLHVQKPGITTEGHFLSKRTECFFFLQFFQDFHFEVIWACFFPLPARKWSLL